MARRILSTLITAAISGAVGFGAGVYATPPDQADEFRALVNSKLNEINGFVHRERAAIELKPRRVRGGGPPIAPEAASKESNRRSPPSQRRSSRRRRRGTERHAGQQRNAGR